MNIEATITIKTDIDELTRCQQAIGLLMCDGINLEGDGKDKVAMLLGFISNAQEQLSEALQTAENRQAA